MKKIFTLCALCASFFSLTTQVFAYDVTVAKDGSGNYTTVQAAIDAAPTNAVAAYTIFIKNGTYKEKITVASNKTFITLIGESVANVILTYDDYSGKAMSGGGTFGTSNSASTIINATDFTAINITFENTTGESPQALAINVNNDRCAFKNCRFLGGQDTLLANNAGKRQYYKQCYIDGTVDFIFGNAAAIFEDCIIYPKTRETGTGNSYITAANTPAGQTYGYVFRNTVINMNRGVTQYFLGRPWQNSTGSLPFAENKVVFLNTTQSGTIINPLGWSTWDAGTQTNLITFAEYQSVTTTGAAVDISSRVAWSQQLNTTQAATYTNANIFTTWDPCAVAGFCTSNTSDIAISNFKGVKGASSAVFTWNASWGIDGVTYTVYRSTDNQVSFQSLYSVNSVGVYDVNFGTTDANPPAGSTYYYYVVGSKAGYTSHTTATVSISSTPTITTVGTLGAFLQGIGTPSSSQSYLLSAVNLLSDLTLTPPANYQISIDNGTTWSFTPLSITPTSGTISSRSVFVRLNAAATGTFSGNIVHASTGAIDVNVAVTGTVQAAPLETIVNLLYFPMTSNNAVDVATQAAGVLTSTPTFSRLVSSDGTTLPAVTAYSATHGQAFAADAAGTWSTAVSGPGGNLSRTHFEQFTVTADAGYSVRVDSLTLNNSFYNTSSNTRLAVWYSKTGFTTADSTSFTGGILGADGTAIVSSPNGTFTTAVLLTNQTSGTTVNYRLALNSSAGVTLTAGQTLTVRLYFSCGSSSGGRYGKIKEFISGVSQTQPYPSV